MHGYDVYEINEIKKAVALATAGLFAPEETLRDVRLCLWELLANALVHQKVRREAVHLSWEIDATSYTFIILDKGCSLAPEAFTAPSTSCVCESILEENGRGLYLVQALADEICYNSLTGELRGIIRW